MGRRRRTPSEPIDLEVSRLGAKGCGVGEHEGRTVMVRGAPPGALVRVRPFKRKKGVVHARRLEMLREPPEAVVPRCESFGLCGGCTLQELPLQSQRAAREEHVRAILEPLDGVRWQGVRGTEAAYGYRNKVELTFGASRFLSEDDHEAGLPIDGRFLGFHAPGRFDRVVEAARCELVSEGLNKVISCVQAFLLESEFEPWNPRQHTGFWRHLVLRESTLGERLVVFYTAPPEDEVAALGEIQALADSLPEVSGVCWYVNERVADAAIGSCRAVLRGREWIEEELGSLRLRLGVQSFFQTNTPGAEVLYQVVGEAVGRGDRLLDLYSGIGSIGLFLADRFKEVVGVEIVEPAVEDARENAKRNGIEHARFISGPVEEVAEGLVADALVVDPPRAGLHPKASRWLADLEVATTLVYVACNPASLARDREILEAGGWRLEDVWCVDLFPQTGHMEAVGRFVR